MTCGLECDGEDGDNEYTTPCTTYHMLACSHPFTKTCSSSAAVILFYTLISQTQKTPECRWNKNRHNHDSITHPSSRQRVRPPDKPQCKGSDNLASHRLHCILLLHHCFSINLPSEVFQIHKNAPTLNSKCFQVERLGFLQMFSTWTRSYRSKLCSTK